MSTREKIENFWYRSEKYAPIVLIIGIIIMIVIMILNENGVLNSLIGRQTQEELISVYDDSLYDAVPPIQVGPISIESQEYEDVFVTISHCFTNDEHIQFRKSTTYNNGNIVFDLDYVDIDTLYEVRNNDIEQEMIDMWYIVSFIFDEHHLDAIHPVLNIMNWEADRVFFCVEQGIVSWTCYDPVEIWHDGDDINEWWNMVVSEDVSAEEYQKYLDDEEYQKHLELYNKIKEEQAFTELEQEEEFKNGNN